MGSWREEDSTWHLVKEHFLNTSIAREHYESNRGQRPLTSGFLFPGRLLEVFDNEWKDEASRRFIISFGIACLSFVTLIIPNTIGYLISQRQERTGSR